jgi:hypothetical protein
LNLLGAWLHALYVTKLVRLLLYGSDPNHPLVNASYRRKCGKMSRDNIVHGSQSATKEKSLTAAIHSCGECISPRCDFAPAASRQCYY